LVGPLYRTRCKQLAKRHENLIPVCETVHDQSGEIVVSSGEIETDELVDPARVELSERVGVSGFVV
jgi:hypothetical protein